MARGEMGAFISPRADGEPLAFFTSLNGPLAWSECSRTRLDDAGNRIFRPATRLRAARYGVPGRVRYRAHCAGSRPAVPTLTHAAR